MAKAKSESTEVVKLKAVPELATVQKKVSPLTKRAKEFVVRDQASYDAAGVGMQKADEFLKSPEVLAFVEHASGLHKLYKQAVKWRDTLIDEADEVKRLLGQKRIDWKAEQDRLERIRIAKEQEKQRLKAIEDAKKEAAEVKKFDPQAAKAIVETAKAAPPPSIAPRRVEDAPGFRTNTTYTFEIFDPDAVPMNYRPISEQLIRKDVNAHGLQANIPGVKVYEHKSQSTVSR